MNTKSIMMIWSASKEGPFLAESGTILLQITLLN